VFRDKDRISIAQRYALVVA